MSDLSAHQTRCPDAEPSRGVVTVAPHRMEDICLVAPSPELRDELRDQFEKLKAGASQLVRESLTMRETTHVGLNDGLIYPGTYYPVGTTASVAQRGALERAPLRGTVRVAVVLVDFNDKRMPAGSVERFEDLFFSTGKLTHGSVKEYFAEVSGGLIDIQGSVVGPYRMPRNVATYAGTENGTQVAAPNARTMANDAVSAADPDIDFGPYDNDGDGFVDAFIVVHAGRGAEQTGAASDIWSHKWVLPSQRSVDGTKIYAYLTIPEDAQIGVSAHELGHLLFGWPDLYDSDRSSEGIGNWCLMAGGSWGLGGQRPVHPSAWCKANQGWINVITQTTNADVTITDVKSSRRAYRLWKDGAGGNEYFLVENRQQTGYDASMPGQGLLIWHIDDAISTNTNEAHYKVALEQADGLRHLEAGTNRGDAGDPFPGSAGNASFSNGSTPNSKSYAGANTEVSVNSIPPSAPSMPVRLTVRASVPKPLKESVKDTVKDIKDLRKESGKELVKEHIKEHFKELRKETVKDVKDLREVKLPDHKFRDLSALPAASSGGAGAAGGDLEIRLSAVEQTLSALAGAMLGQDEQWGYAGEPFIGSDERPTLGDDLGRPDLGELRAQMERGSAQAKAAYDSLPPS